MDNKQDKQREQKEKISQRTLRELRQHFRKEAEKAIKQIKENHYLSLQQIREAEDLFDNIEDTNLYLKKKNVEKKKIKQHQTENKIKHNKIINQKQIQIQEKNSRQSIIQTQKITNNINQIDEVSYDYNRKWNEKLENPKKGLFDQRQKKILFSSLSQFLVQNNIQLQEFVNRIHNNEINIAQDLGMWRTVCSVLPNRSLKSCYKYFIRNLSKGIQKIKWSQDQQQLLLALHKKYGNKWRQIAQQLGKRPQNVRDKFRNLINKQSKQRQQNLWKIGQLIQFMKQIQIFSQVNFIKQGVNDLIINESKHDQKEQQNLKNYKYNSKFILSHNVVSLMEYIDTNQFCQIEINKIKWKQISDKLNKSETDCKNKFFMFMEIFNKDYTGENERKVIIFIDKVYNNKNKQIAEHSIPWNQWNQETGLTIQQAKWIWRMIKKKIYNRSGKSFAQIINQAKQINQKKIRKNRLIQDKYIQITQQKLQKKKQRNKKNHNLIKNRKKSKSRGEDFHINKSKKIEKIKIPKNKKRLLKKAKNSVFIKTSDQKFNLIQENNNKGKRINAEVLRDDKIGQQKIAHKANQGQKKKLFNNLQKGANKLRSSSTKDRIS